MQKRILVTGGAGFLGANLCKRLLKQGGLVFCVDNFHTSSRTNISHLLKEPYFKLIEQDIRTPLDLEVDEIYNLACPASPHHYQADPIYTTTTCVVGSLNLLELAKKNKAKIFQASTSEVYGDPQVHPQTETYRGSVNPIGIRSCYDEGKRCAESIFFDHHRMYNTEIRVARIFNTYGPQMRPEDGRVVSNFIVQALKEKPITIYGDGTQTRSFCYVDDLVDGIILLMANQMNFVGPVNLGNPAELTVKSIAHKIITLTGSKSELKYIGLPQDDPLRRRPDIRLANEMLQWRPRILIEDGLVRTLAYFKQVLS